MFFKINLKNFYKGRDIMDISLTTYNFGRRSVIFSESLNAIPYWSMSESHKQIKMRKPAYKYPQQLQSLTVFLAKTLMPLTYRSRGNFERVVWDPSDSSKNCILTEIVQTWPRVEPDWNQSPNHDMGMAQDIAHYKYIPWNVLFIIEIIFVSD